MSVQYNSWIELSLMKNDLENGELRTDQEVMISDPRAMDDGRTCAELRKFSSKLRSAAVSHDMEKTIKKNK